MRPVFLIKLIIHRFLTNGGIMGFEAGPHSKLQLPKGLDLLWPVRR